MTVERVWPQVNARVNYPLKRILYALQESNTINMSCPITKFCVSFVVIKSAAVGMNRFVSAWNSHFIAGNYFNKSYNFILAYLKIGKGIPIELSHFSGTVSVTNSDIPTTDIAVQDYEQNQGGPLVHFSSFGDDPLKERLDLVTLRDQHFANTVGTYDAIFNDVVSGEGDHLCLAITVFDSLTKRLSQFI